MENVIFTQLTIPEVRGLLRQELEDFFSVSLTRKTDQPNLANINGVTAAVKFLEEQGYPISESKIYKETAAKNIPCRTFGNRLLFTSKDLLDWVESQTVDENSTSNITLTLAKSARRKQNKG